MKGEFKVGDYVYAEDSIDKGVWGVIEFIKKATFPVRVRDLQGRYYNFLPDHVRKMTNEEAMLWKLESE